MRNVFQARTGVEASVVRNMLVANGIPATVNRQGFTFIGSACSEVWVEDDASGERAVELIRELYADQPHSGYAASRALGAALQIAGLVCAVAGAVSLLLPIVPGERLAVMGTSFVLFAVGVYVYGQGRTESRLARSRAALSK
jgi:hypothetical protein